MTPEVLAKLDSLAAAGASILLVDAPSRSPSLANYPACDQEVRQLVERLVARPTVRTGPWQDDSLQTIGIPPDCHITSTTNEAESRFAWAHRRTKDADVFFVSNQQASSQTLRCMLRTDFRGVRVLDPATGVVRSHSGESVGKHQLAVKLDFAPTRHCSLWPARRLPTRAAPWRMPRTSSPSRLRSMAHGRCSSIALLAIPRQP